MKTLISTLFTIALTASLNVHANEEVTLQKATEALVENSSVQMESKLATQLQQDINESLYAMRVANIVEISPTLLAKAESKTSKKADKADEE